VDDLPVYNELLTLLDFAADGHGDVLDSVTARQLAADLRAARSCDRGRLSAAHEVQDGLAARIDELAAEVRAVNDRERARTQARLDAGLAHRNRWQIAFGRRKGAGHG
jgi:hypothetical protein